MGFVIRQTKVARGSGYINTTYDGLSRLKTVNTNGRTLTYLDTVTRGNGVVSKINYDAMGRATNFDHVNFNNASFDYNPASQLISRVVSNSAYQIEIPDVGNQTYITNELNQYTKVGTKTISYDAAANLKSYDGWTYAYNAHNRIK